MACTVGGELCVGENLRRSAHAPSRDLPSSAESDRGYIETGREERLHKFKLALFAVYDTVKLNSISCNDTQLLRLSEYFS